VTKSESTNMVTLLEWTMVISDVRWYPGLGTSGTEGVDD